MRIINLTAENYKRLVAIDITPTGAIVDINGKNGQGKSSTLDAIYAALAGKSAIPSKPVRKGEEKAFITVKLGTDEVELVVRRSFQTTPDGDYTTSLVVENGKGARYPSPQAMLDGLLGALSFDPLAFTRMAPKLQLEELRKLVPDFDFAAVDAAIDADFKARTDVNREAKSLANQHAALTIPGDPRAARVDMAALVKALEDAGDAKAKIRAEENDRAVTLRQIDDDRQAAKNNRALAEARRKDAEDLRQRIAKLEESAQGFDTLATDYEAEANELEVAYKALAPLPAYPDTASLVARIDAGRKTNADLDERDRVTTQKAEFAEQLKAKEAEAEQLTKKIDDAKARKAKAIADAKLPVDGLGFGDDGVTLNGLPFAQASDAEMLRVSIAIAAAMNPTLKVIRARDGSLLDDDSLQIVREFAEKHGLQLWLERVATNSPIGIRIEDGRVANVGEVAA